LVRWALESIFIFYGGKKMKRIGSISLVAVLLGVGMLFMACGKEQQGSQGAAAGEWKWTRKITFISPWGPGGGSGPTIRNIVPLVQEVIGIPCEVAHQEGAGGLNGAVAANRQPADGYTWLLATQSQILLDLQGQMPFDFKEEWIPVAKLVHSTNGLMASAKAASGKYTDWKSFIAYVKANPRTVSAAMLSSGGTDMVCMYQTLSLALGVPIGQVNDYVKITPYSGGSEIDAALVGGHVDTAIGGPGDSAGLIESGDVIPLIVMAEKRMKSFPDIPCTGEMGIPAYIGTWRGIWAKKGTPQAAIDAMEKALEKAYNMKPYQDFVDAEGYDERTGFEGQADFKKLVDSEYNAFTDYFRSTGQLKK
jgi:tripartite-type tricarboxylate transporter receptor subunit TctC